MLSLFNVPPDILTFERSQFIQAIQLAVQVLRDYPCCMKAEKRLIISVTIDSRTRVQIISQCTYRFEL